MPVYAFSLLLALGAIAGLSWAAWQSSEKEATQITEAGIWALLGALLGGRILFVAINWTYFQSHPWESLQVYLGGISWSGALAGGLLVLTLFVRLNQQSLLEMADALVPLLVCLTVSAWLGCWLDGCIYGEVTSAWWGVPSPDEWGLVSSRSPVQLLGAMFTVGLFWSSERGVKLGTYKPGTLSCLGLLNLFLISFGLSFLRADPALTWNGLHLDAWAALVFANLGLVVLLIIYRRKKDKA